MHKIKERIESGAEYEIVFSADDVCAFCPNLIDGVCIDEEKVLRYDRLSIQKKDISEICADCGWYDMQKYLMLRVSLACPIFLYENNFE